MKLIEKIIKIISNLLSKKLIKWIVIPFLLILLWISLSLFYSSYRSFTVLQYGHDVDSLNNFGERKLLKSQKIKGFFEAKENNLGIIAVRFGDIPKVAYEEEDLILFRIREKEQQKWIYENNYRSGSFYQNQYFPFGFDQIEDSKGKVYEFELISLKGDQTNSIEIKNTNPIYFSKYKFPKSEVFQNFNSILKFMSQKLITFFTNYDVLLSSLIFLLPLFFYVLWIIFYEKWIRSKVEIGSKNLFTILIIVLILLDIIFYEFLNKEFMLVLLSLWVFCIYINKFKSSLNFAFSVLFIGITIVSFYFDLKMIENKAGSYAYFFILIGFVKGIIEGRKYKARI